MSPGVIMLLSLAGAFASIAILAVFIRLTRDVHDARLMRLVSPRRGYALDDPRIDGIVAAIRDPRSCTQTVGAEHVVFDVRYGLHRLRITMRRDLTAAMIEAPGLMPTARAHADQPSPFGLEMYAVLHAAAEAAGLLD